MAPWSSCRTSCCGMLLLLCCAAAALLPTALAYECDSGILQMKALPQDLDSCYSAPMSADSIKAACTAALRVRVKNGILKIVPLVQETFTVGESEYEYSEADPSKPMDMSYIPFNCKDLNASGLFYPGSTTSASVMLYDDYGGPLSNLTKTAPDQVSLFAGNTISLRGPSQVCQFNYTVVQGCVFGIKAPAKPAATCPAGYVPKKGRFAVSYCAPCAPGTYHDKASGSCKPCAVGTYNLNLGATKCTKCDIGYYANTTGSEVCTECSSFDNLYTDGKTCKPCPKGSYVSSEVSGQCHRCDVGKRCCTAGWNKSCPKCPAGVKGARSSTSIFALEAATPSSCFTTGHALCAPKISIIVDSTCTISLDNRGYNNNPDDTTLCGWSTSTSQKTPWVKGAQISIKDLASFESSTDNQTLLSGNFTSAASPYITVNILATKCTLRYRALTSPLADLLGAAPKPSKATSCPVGHYLENATDTKPGPCLLCPPGTYSPRASTASKCLSCPAGTYTNRYGSTVCKRCPAGRVASPGSAWCRNCDMDSYPRPDGKGCKPCPADSFTYYGAGGDRACLGNAYGSVCCAAGNCTGQPLCKGPRLPSAGAVNSSSQSYTAVLQLVSKSASKPTCKNSTILSCLPAQGKVLVSSAASSPAVLRLEPYRTKFTCGNYISYYSGWYTGAKSAFVSANEQADGGDVVYNLVSDSSKGTLTVDLSPSAGNGTAGANAASACSATFKIISGYAFDLTPPKGAKCDPADVENTYGGRKFCQPCGLGYYKNSTTACERCPAGTYSDTAGAASCKPCRPGYSCWFGSESACGMGTYSSKPRQIDCRDCPKNTFGSASGYIPNIKCTACPNGTIAPTGATVCGVPWDKQFPA